MKYFALEYSGELFEKAFNLGDDIQTIAVSRLLPRVDGYLSRESLDAAKESGIICLNGYFMNSDHWPPAPGLTPVFFSFHITPNAEKTICSPAGIRYLKAHEPIGCRDVGTVRILKDHGVDAYYTKCLTLTFERRDRELSSGKVYVVGVSKAARSIIPRSLRKRAIWVDQAKVRLPSVPSDLKFRLANHLLNVYRQTASLVITSKIHCALPCIAMGIPVVFIYSRRNLTDYRVKLIDDLVGINYVPSTWIDKLLFNRLRSRRINWQPQALNIEEEKQVIKSSFLEALRLAKSRHREKQSQEGS
jgi:hypothetical protein